MFAPADNGRVAISVAGVAIMMDLMDLMDMMAVCNEDMPRRYISSIHIERTISWAVGLFAIEHCLASL